MVLNRSLNAVFLFFSLFSLQSLALEPIPFSPKSIITKVFEIEELDPHASFLNVLSLADGRVYRLERNNEETLKALRVALVSKAPVIFIVDEKEGDRILSVEAPGTRAFRNDAYPFLKWESERNIENATMRNREAFGRETWTFYSPTVLESLRDAEKHFEAVFSYRSGFDVEDHCYDRAHYWARSLDIQFKTKSQKLFLFFTAKYRRDHSYKWWFHVAPLVLVNEGSASVEYVLDPTFESRPLHVKPWSDDFAPGAKKCISGRSVTDFHRVTDTEDCVLVRASMYHYMTNDLDGTDTMSEWRCSDLKRVMAGIPGPGKAWNEVKGFLPVGCR